MGDGYGLGVGKEAMVGPRRTNGTRHRIHRISSAFTIHQFHGASNEYIFHLIWILTDQGLLHSMEGV